MRETRYPVSVDWSMFELALRTPAHRIGRDIHFAIKRGLDIIIASVALVLLSPLLLLVAILVRLDSPGSAIFKQERITARRKSTPRGEVWEPVRFTCYKFRSMYRDAGDAQHRAFIKAFMHNDKSKMAEMNGTQDDFKLAHDLRVSRMGRIIRKTSIDEIPQLVNVLRGEMSIVGPRPAIPYEVDEYQPWHHKRLTAKAGLTGWWQVNGRDSIEFDEGMKQDVWYCEHQSPLLDLVIIAKTPMVLFKGK